MKKRFIIPANFMETGYLMNGAVPARNAVEAVILGLVGYFICQMLPIPEGTDAITYYILIIAPFALAGLYGVQGDPLSVFIMDYFKWRKRRKPSFYNEHSEAYTQEAADLLMDTPQFRDMLADVLDKVRTKFAEEDIDYVEGKTFEFASDPEQEALKEAQNEITAKREAELAKLMEALQKQEAEQAQKQEQEAKASVFVQPENAGSVNAQQIAEMMVLDKLDWEEEE